jgi:hypothetical protein
MERTFTLQEAQTLLPVLQSLLRTAIAAKHDAEDIERDFEQLRTRLFTTGGMLLDIKHWARRRAERDKAVQRVKDALAEIDAIGVQVKDLDIGLLDFPCVVEDRLILLCWKLGEEKIAHWHSVEEGFAGRKPIDERIANAKGRRKS